MMDKPINFTNITLIPKSNDANAIKQYTPIACCTILYEIIFMILITRLNSVLGSVVDDAQIMGHILLTIELTEG